MTVTAPVFTKFTMFQQILAKNFFTEFHENPTDGIVADIRLYRDRKTDGRA
jgi:hypothetical protein